METARDAVENLSWDGGVAVRSALWWYGLWGRVHYMSYIFRSMPGVAADGLGFMGVLLF